MHCTCFIMLSVWARGWSYSSCLHLSCHCVPVHAFWVWSLFLLMLTLQAATLTQARFVAQSPSKLKQSLSRICGVSRAQWRSLKAARWALYCLKVTSSEWAFQYQANQTIDCSHAHGASINGQKTRTFGDGAAWWIQGDKVLSGGEGGLHWLVTLRFSISNCCMDISTNAASWRFPRTTLSKTSLSLAQAWKTGPIHSQSPSLTINCKSCQQSLTASRGARLTS